MKSRATRRRVTTYTGINSGELRDVLLDCGGPHPGTIVRHRGYSCKIAKPIWPAIEYDLRGEQLLSTRYRCESLAMWQLLEQGDAVQGFAIRWDQSLRTLVILHPDENVLMHIKMILQL